MSGTAAKAAAREQRLLNSIALIASGGHTFTVERGVLHVPSPLEVYTVTVPPEEGELRIVRCGQRNDGPFGVEFEWTGRAALTVERSLWWVHAIHATTRLAEDFNRREAGRRA